MYMELLGTLFEASFIQRTAFLKKIHPCRMYREFTLFLLLILLSGNAVIYLLIYPLMDIWVLVSLLNAVNILQILVQLCVFISLELITGVGIVWLGEGICLMS